MGSDRGGGLAALRRVLTALVAAAAAFGLAAGVGQRWRAAAAAAAAAAVAGFAAALLRDVDVRMRRVERAALDSVDRAQEALERAVEQVELRFAQLTTVPEAFGLQVVDRPRAAELVGVVQNAYSFEHRSSPLAVSFVRAEAQRFSQLLRQLRVGEGTYPGEDRDWLLGLTGVCMRSLDATSLTTTDSGGRMGFGGGFWDSDLGLRYLEQQAAAVDERGVKVRRVFILDDSSLTGDATYQRVCDRQARAGFDVRYLTPDMVSVDLSNKLDDFVVFDNEISYEVVPALAAGDSRPVISSTRLTVDRRLVGTRVAQFARLWDAALPCRDIDEGLDYGPY